jgi:hypothetical protein
VTSNYSIYCRTYASMCVIIMYARMHARTWDVHTLLHTWVALDTQQIMDIVMDCYVCACVGILLFIPVTGRQRAGDRVLGYKVGRLADRWNGGRSDGSARLGSARLNSARLGSARLGSARLGSARLDSARLGWAGLGSGRLDPKTSFLYYFAFRLFQILA